MPVGILPVGTVPCTRRDHRHRTDKYLDIRRPIATAADRVVTDHFQRRNRRTADFPSYYLPNSRHDTRCYFNTRSKAYVSQLIYRTETTTKKRKTEKVKTNMFRSNSKSQGNHVVSLEKEKERRQREGFAEKEGFKSGMKERVHG